MGGAVGVLKAANDVRIQRLISHAGMVETQHFYTAEFGDLTPDNALMWDEPHCPLSSAFKKDLCETIASTAACIPHIRQAWLLLHGTQDSVVPISDSQKAPHCVRIVRWLPLKAVIIFSMKVQGMTC